MIAAGSALVVALISWAASRSNHARLLENQAELQRRRLRLDMTLDSQVHAVYALGRLASRALSDDFDLARLGTQALPYDPRHEQAPQWSVAQPQRYWQQGVPRGIFENAVESLLVKDGENERVMSCLEFERALADQNSVAHDARQRIRYLLLDFHPAARPVLWRVLLVNACLHQAMARLAERGPVTPPPSASLPRCGVRCLTWAWRCSGWPMTCCTRTLRSPWAGWPGLAVCVAGAV